MTHISTTFAELPIDPDHGTCWRVFHGDAADTSAQVYLELRTPHGEDGGPNPVVVPDRLEASIEGPFSDLSVTLPARTRFRSAGPGATLLWKANLPDPCFWTPDLPVWYRVRASHTALDRHLDTTLAIRRLGHRDRDFIWNARRYVFRSIDIPQDTEDVSEWWNTLRNSGTSLRLEPSHTRRLELASRWGVPVLLDVRFQGSSGVDCVREALQYPAVAVALLAQDQWEWIARWKHEAPNVLLAGWWSRAAPNSYPPPALGLDALAFTPTSQTELATLLAQTSLPLIACSSKPHRYSIEQARAECDRLQRDLAPYTRLAGYCVWNAPDL